MNNKNWIYALIIIVLGFTSCKTKQDAVRKYVIADQQLFDQIFAMDQTFFDAYNNCDLEKQAAIYADDIEFLHDKGGLMTSKADLIEGTKRNICGKVTRQLVDKSIEVYPINNYGAVEIGFHKFYNNQEPDAESKPSKFIIIWKKDHENWKITRVVSLH